MGLKLDGARSARPLVRSAIRFASVAVRPMSLTVYVADSASPALRLVGSAKTSSFHTWPSTAFRTSKAATVHEALAP